MHKIRQKRISQQEQDELAEVLYCITEEDEKEVSAFYKSSLSTDWDEEARFASINFE